MESVTAFDWIGMARKLTKSNPSLSEPDRGWILDALDLVESNEIPKEEFQRQMARLGVREFLRHSPLNRPPPDSEAFWTFAHRSEGKRTDREGREVYNRWYLPIPLVFGRGERLIYELIHSDSRNDQQSITDIRNHLDLCALNLRRHVGETIWLPVVAVDEHGNSLDVLSRWSALSNQIRRVCRPESYSRRYDEQPAEELAL